MAWWRADLPGELLCAGVRQDRGRFTLALLAIALGVALGCAVHLINRQASAEMLRATQDLAGEAHLVVNGPRAGFDENIWVQLAQLPFIQALSPALELDIKRHDSDDTLRVMALDIFRAAQVQPGLLPQTTVTDDRVAALRADNLFVSATAKAAWQLELGQSVTLQVGTRPVVLTVAGLLSAPGVAPLAVMDLGAAQQAFEKFGVLNRIDIKLHADADPDASLQAIAARLPAGVQVRTVAQSDTVASRISRAYRVNLNVLSLVALFTGTLLVYATLSLSVQRRAMQHALWRALGVTRHQLQGALLVEATILGLVGGVLGVALGWALAQVLLQLMQGDLGAGARLAVAPGALFSWPVALAMVSGGVVSALSGAWLSAKQAARIPVAAALKAQDSWHWETHARGSVAGVMLWVCGGLLCWLPPWAELPVFGYLAIAAMLLGTLALLPGVARVLLGLIGDRLPVDLALAGAQLRGSSRQVSISMAATMAAVSLSVAMAIMVTSFRDSLDDWLDRVLPADLYVRAGQPNDSAFIDADVRDGMRRIDGVARLQFQRSQMVSLASDKPNVVLLARDGAQGELAVTLPLIGPSPPPAHDGVAAVWVSEVAAALHGLKTGQQLQIPIAGRAEPFRIAGTWRDYARQQGALLIQRQHYVKLTGDERINEAALWLARGIALDTVTRAVRGLAADGALEVWSARELRQFSLTLFDRTFAVTYALEAVAVLIGLLGLSSSLGALILARRREFGVLRHLGYTPSRVRRLLVVEGVLTTGTGLVVGAALGTVMSAVLIHVINRQSFHWSMDVTVPYAGLMLFSVSLLLTAAMTAWWAARQALGGEVLRAVRQDW